MSKRKRKITNTRTAQQSSIVWLSGDEYSKACSAGYTSLDRNPEVMAAVRQIAELIGSATIHLMSNTEAGDERIINELSRLIDIEPIQTMTRNTWMEAIVMNLLLYGKGNSIVVPHTYNGFIQSLEPISAERVQLQPVGTSYRDYKVLIDGVARDPASLLHFVYNPDKTYLWKGRGMDVTLREIANNLKQARTTETAFLTSEYKPSIIVKVDAMADEFSTPEGRQTIIDSYMKPAQRGEPWLIPAEQFDVQQVKPLTLSDLAINDSMVLNKRTIAAIVGVPPFVVGVGEYDRHEWNKFIQTKIMTIAKLLAAEMTKKLIINPKWYLVLNIWSLMDYDIQTVSNVLLAGSDRGFVNGDEWRDRMHMNPAGLKEFRVLENYIPWEMSGQQSKLQGGD